MKRLILIAGLALYSNMVWATHEVCIAVYPPPPECVHDDDDSNSAAIIAAVAVVGGLIYYATKKRSKNKYISFSKKRIEPRWQIGFVSLSHQQRPKFFRKRNSMQIQCGVFFQYDF